MDQSQDHLWKIGQVAERAGVSVDTVRYYERRGLVTPAHRASSRYRYYRPDAVDRILLARNLQDLGMTLDEIAQALQDHDLHGGTCDSQRWRLEAVRDRLTAQLGELTAVLHDVNSALANCASGNCTLLTSPPGELPQRYPAFVRRCGHLQDDDDLAALPHAGIALAEYVVLAEFIFSARFHGN
jgi:DNA-binding transcriptional MerR regulator